MKLGVVYATEGYNAGYRAVWPAEALCARSGHEFEQVTYDPGEKFDYRSLLDRDVVHVYRRTDRYAIRMADDLRARGIAITYDNDDDVRLIPKDGYNHKQLGGIAGQRDFRTQVNMMRRAHIVSTTSDVLAAKWAEEYAGPIEVIPNSLASFHFDTGPRNEDGVVIGWFAAEEHVADAKRLRISQTLQRVMDRRPEVRVVSVGVRLDLPAERYTHHTYIPLYELVSHLRRFDIGIAPISDIPFSYARSDIKVKEYAAVGVPWVASNRGSYARLGGKCGGILVDDDGWEEALVGLAGSKFRRAQMRRQALKWAKSEHIDRNVGRWLALWERAVERAASEPSQGRRAAVAR